MKTFTSFLVGIALFFTTTAIFAQNITLELVKGNASGGLAYSLPIPVSSAQYSFTTLLSYSSQSSGTAAGKVNFLPLVITKQLDASTASLQTSVATGSPYQYIRLNFYRADGTLGYRVVFGFAAVSNYSASGVPGCPSGCPTLAETVSFEYGQVATYNPAATGALRIFTWNRITNTSNVDPNIPTSAITQ